jgi:hypothetical protein
MENWEEKYWDLWQKEDDLTHLDEDILVFIRQLLVQKEKEVIEKLMKEIKDKKRLKQMWNTDSPSWERIEADRLIYNQAIDDIINLLKNKTK